MSGEAISQIPKAFAKTLVLAALVYGARHLLFYLVETGMGDQEVYMHCSVEGCPLYADMLVNGRPCCILHGLVLSVANDN